MDSVTAISLLISLVGTLATVWAAYYTRHIDQRMQKAAREKDILTSLDSEVLKKCAQNVGKTLEITGKNEKKEHWTNADTWLAQRRLANISNSKFVKSPDDVWAFERTFGTDHCTAVSRVLYDYANIFTETCKLSKIREHRLNEHPAASVYKGVVAILNYENPKGPTKYEILE